MHNTTSGEVVNDTSLFSEDLASINTKTPLQSILTRNLMLSVRLKNNCCQQGDNVCHHNETTTRYQLLNPKTPANRFELPCTSLTPPTHAPPHGYYAIMAMLTRCQGVQRMLPEGPKNSLSTTAHSKRVRSTPHHRW